MIKTSNHVKANWNYIYNEFQELKNTSYSAKEPETDPLCSSSLPNLLCTLWWCLSVLDDVDDKAAVDSRLELVSNSAVLFTLVENADPFLAVDDVCCCWPELFVPPQYSDAAEPLAGETLPDFFLFTASVVALLLPAAAGTASALDTLVLLICCSRWTSVEDFSLASIDDRRWLLILDESNDEALWASLRTLVLRPALPVKFEPLLVCPLLMMVSEIPSAVYTMITNEKYSLKCVVKLHKFPEFSQWGSVFTMNYEHKYQISLASKYLELLV